MCKGRIAALSAGAEPCAGGCGGEGWIHPEPESEELDAEVVEGVGEFLQAWGLVQQHGPVGALCLLGEMAAGWDPGFVESMAIFDDELERQEARWRPSNSR